MPTIKIVRARRTCMACPSQWDMWDDEGNYVYVRFRHGHLRISYEDEHDFRMETRRVIFESYPGDGMDGFMTEPELIELTAQCLDFTHTQWETEWIETLEFNT